jgi:GNAT superfamily N-acetyltransferase
MVENPWARDPAGMLPMTLRDGTLVVVRPQTREDRPRLADFFAGLSPRSRYQRFFTGMPPKLPSRMLDVLANVDGERHVGLVAVRGSRILGAARYLRRADAPAAADVAFTVADELHGRGLGGLLMRELQAHARRRGITRFHFDALATNEAALTVARSLGARLQRDGAIVEGVIYIESGAETPSRPSARAMVRRVATQRPSRNDSRSCGSAPSTRQSR